MEIGWREKIAIFWGVSLYSGGGCAPLRYYMHPRQPTTFLIGKTVSSYAVISCMFLWRSRKKPPIMTLPLLCFTIGMWCWGWNIKLLKFQFESYPQFQIIFDFSHQKHIILQYFILQRWKDLNRRPLMAGMAPTSFQQKL